MSSYDNDFTVITGPEDRHPPDSKSIAYGLVVRLKMDIQQLPRFSGQTQLVGAIRRLTQLALWKKG